MKTFRNLKTPLVKNCHCLDFVGGTFTDGYGAVWVKGTTRTGARGRPVAAHRVVYEEAFGPTKHDVLHHCDRKICVELRHLYAGDDLDNARDREMRNRSGPRHSRAVVEAVRKDPGRGIDIAKKYGVSTSFVSRVRRGHVRKYLPPPS